MYMHTYIHNDVLPLLKTTYEFLVVMTIYDLRYVCMSVCAILPNENSLAALKKNCIYCFDYSAEWLQFFLQDDVLESLLVF